MIGRQRDGAGAEAPLRVFGLVQIPLGGRQLVFENLRQLGELFALQLRGNFHVALGHGVQNLGNEHRVGAAQLQCQEVAVHVHLDL